MGACNREIALATPPAGVRVWLVDLENLKAMGAHVAHEPGRAAAGRFHGQRGDRPRAPNPRQQFAVAGGIRRK
jgi:hypothetical protein